MDLAPTTRDELAAMLQEASAHGRVLDIRGGGLHSRRGRPFTPDDTILTRGLSRVVDYVPDDMTITVEGGVTIAEILAAIGGHRQAWPQAPADPTATVGGVLAAAVSGRRRLRDGPVRDSLLEVVVATGDGRIIKGGGRTVKTVTGYDLPRLLTGSLGTLGVIVQATLRVWPVPMAEQWFTAHGDDGDMLAIAHGVLAGRHRPAAVILTPGAAHVCLTGVPDDMVAPPGMAEGSEPVAPMGPGTVQMGVPPAALPAVVRHLSLEARPFEAWLGTGICHVIAHDAADVTAVRDLATSHSGHAQVVDGDDALRADPFGPVPAGADIMRHLRSSFDPAGILCPGRFAAAAPVPA